MFDYAINNETDRGLALHPFLTNNPSNKEMSIMAKSTIPEAPKICQVEECNNPHYSRGYCKKHYRRKHANGEFEGQRLCSVDNCDKGIYMHSLCLRHYQQIKYNGHIFGDPQRTRITKNKTTLTSDSCIIDLYTIRGEKNAETVVDREDYEIIKQYKWSLRNNDCPYVRTVINGEFVDLTRVLLGTPPEGFLIDHKDCNPLNNKRDNLRFATKSQNTMNSKTRSDNSSGYRGVGLDRNGHWSAYITLKGKQRHLGTFQEKQKAVIAREQAEENLFGEFAFNG